MAGYSIRQIVDKVSNGQIRIPVFQRGFVWEPEAVAFLMDSIYKQYPIGSLLFWRTRETLRAERTLGPFALIDKDPAFPIDYVLDGQQRITSIFGVMQTELSPISDDSMFKIYFDLKADPHAQETQFLALSNGEINPERHFPLNALFDTVEYRKQTSRFGDEDIKKMDKLQEVFKEVNIPIQLIETDEKTKVAIVFERINRKGVPLDTFQLLSAWTWSEDFDLRSKFDELKEELEPFGFEEIGNNVDLLLRCTSSILNKNASAESLVNLNGAVVREKFKEIVNGIAGAIDFLKNNLKIETLDNLPYDAILVPLSVFFAVSGNEQVRYDGVQRDKLLKWFWKVCFSRRYSAGVLRNLNRDIEEMVKLRKKEPSNIDNITVNLSEHYFTSNAFRVDTVNTKTFVLLLAQQNPRSFITGNPVTLREVLRDYNKNEFHHLYPNKYLRTQSKLEYKSDVLANYCFMSRGENNELGGDAPSIYKTKMNKRYDAILSSALCPDSLFNDKFNEFIRDRAKILLAKANDTIN